MVKVKLAVVRCDGEILKKGIYGSSEDAAARARKAQEYSDNKGLGKKITCKFEEFDIVAINISKEEDYWTERYYIHRMRNQNTNEHYWRVANHNLTLQTGLFNPKFNQEAAEKYFTDLLKTKVCQPLVKVHFLELADGTKMRNLY